MRLDDVLQQLRAALAGRMAASQAQTRAIEAALDAYVAAHAAELAADFAERNGLPAPGATVDASRAALALRDLVARLPELADGAAAPSAAAPSAAAPRARWETLDLPTIESEQRALADEFDATAFAGMRLDEFMLHAEEFAARARALQERSGGDPVSQRVIRRLTALVHERHLPKKVFGLSRAHEGDWHRLAVEARARRLEARPPTSSRVG